MIIEEIDKHYRCAPEHAKKPESELQSADAYSGASQLIQSLTRPNGSYTEYQYNDPLKKLTEVINKKSTGDVINKFEYTYNSRDLIATGTVTNGQIIDNFIAGTTTETPNILNQIMSRTEQGQTKTYVYDLDGNMTTGFTPEGYPITMTYDAQNRMKSAEFADSGSVTHRNEYSYAGNSLLAELKKYDAGALTATTKYLRGGFLPLQERDAANTVSREYTWGLNLGGGIGGLLNLRQGGADYSYLYDGKGNVSALIDSSQSVVASYAYDPFGQLMSKSGTLNQPYTFSTKEYDSRTGLNYYGYRFYDSCSGKWTTRDPLEEAGGLNLYGFVGNNPVNWVDPLGLDFDVCFTWEAASGYGHIGFGFPGEPTTFGFYPTGNFIKSPGIIKPDTQPGYQCKTIKSSPDEDKKMMECRGRRQTTPGDYMIHKRQCTDMVRECMAESGLPTGDYGGPRPDLFFKELPGKFHKRQ